VSFVYCIRSLTSAWRSTIQTAPTASWRPKKERRPFTSPLTSRLSVHVHATDQRVTGSNLTQRKRLHCLL